MPKTRSLVVAALFAVFVVGGAALLITHPWDPSATQTRATTPADTSRSGYPGEVKELSGQDARKTEEAEDGGQQNVTEEDGLSRAYASLADYSDRVDENEQELRDACEDLSSADFSSGLKEAQAVSLDVSNLIARIELLTGVDEEDVENLLTLGNWLRNRCDALTEAWELGASSDDLEGNIDSILAGADESAEYGRHFDDNYEGWNPSA